MVKNKQMLLFTSEGISLKEACYRDISSKYPGERQEVIENAVLFAGFPMYKNEGFHSTFMDRVKYYIKTLQYVMVMNPDGTVKSVNWDGFFKDNKVEKKSKVEKFKIKFTPVVKLEDQYKFLGTWEL